MMTRSLVLPLALLALHYQEASASCLSSINFIIPVRYSCDYDNVLESIERKLHMSGCNNDDPLGELMELLGVSQNNGNNAENEVKSKIKHICAGATETKAQSFMKFSEISGRGDNFDADFFNGGTFLNTEVQKTVNGVKQSVLKEDAKFVRTTFENTAQVTGIQFPDHLSNFASCEANTVMCCWVGDRQANDDNGNCETPYASQCIDSVPDENTGLCKDDPSIATDVLNKYRTVHCHGFGWGDNETENDFLYRGNNLFYVSMYDHLYERGYVKNVPGYPMCGCIEQMPTVERADCTEIYGMEKYKFTYQKNLKTFAAELVHTEIWFEECRGDDEIDGWNDLESFMTRLYKEEKISEAQLDIVNGKLDVTCPYLWDDDYEINDEVDDYWDDDWYKLTRIDDAYYWDDFE